MSVRLPIYPSLMDAFQRVMDAATEEQQKLFENDFFDKINRVQRPSTPAMLRGTALNEVVDRYIATYGTEDGWQSIAVDGNQFTFDCGLVEKIAERVDGAIVQPYCEHEIATQYGGVMLYGFADYVIDDAVIDLKTTSDYSPGNYRRGWQRHVYPYILAGSKCLSAVRTFTYLVAEVQEVDGTIAGNVMEECYTVDVEQSRHEIVNFIDSSFIPFILQHREKITDEKIGRWLMTK